MGNLQSPFGVPDRNESRYTTNWSAAPFVQTDIVAIMDKIKAMCEAAPRAEGKFKAGTRDFHVRQPSIG